MAVHTKFTRLEATGWNVFLPIHGLSTMTTRSPSQTTIIDITKRNQSTTVSGFGSRGREPCQIVLSMTRQ